VPQLLASDTADEPAVAAGADRAADAGSVAEGEAGRTGDACGLTGADQVDGGLTGPLPRSAVPLCLGGRDAADDTAPVVGTAGDIAPSADAIAAAPARRWPSGLAWLLLVGAVAQAATPSAATTTAAPVATVTL
jgi:hypothetical protein